MVAWSGRCVNVIKSTAVFPGTLGCQVEIERVMGGSAGIGDIFCCYCSTEHDPSRDYCGIVMRVIYRYYGIFTEFI